MKKLLFFVAALLASNAFADQESAHDEAYKAALQSYLAQDLIAAMAQLEEGAAAGHPDSMVLLAYILDKAEENARAVELYRRAAELNHPEAELGLGNMYSNGEGVERDYAQALYWIRRAVERDYGPAISVLAEAYLNGGFGLDVDRDAAIALLERAESLGYAPAAQRLENLGLRTARPDAPDTATTR